MNFTIRFLVSFLLICIPIGFLSWLGLAPSTYTVLITIIASLMLAYITKPEGEE